MKPTAGVTQPMLVIVLGRAHRSLAAYLEQGLALQGISMGDFAVLEVLLHKGPLAPAAIAAKLPVPNTQVARIIDRLTTRHLVRARAERRPVHARSYELTEEGRRVSSDVYEGHTTDIEAILDTLSASERTSLGQMLKRIGTRAAALGQARSRNLRGGLSGWQERRAIEYMTAHLADRVLLADVAAQVGLSASRFGRAFKVSMGVSPHRWQTELRVAEAQELLREGKRSLAEIALATGFAEQSHFSRVFKEVVGMAPGVWQRRRRA
jgi:AraC-like DNA-binding protein/DNA-binding MarR family transcriptional regulator